MSTPPKAPGSTLSNVLTILSGAGGYVTLGIQVAGVVIPLVKALISKIEGIGGPAVVITFSDVLAADEALIQSIIDSSNADLAAVNAELARIGLPTLPEPPPPSAAA